MATRFHEFPSSLISLCPLCLTQTPTSTQTGYRCAPGTHTCPVLTHALATAHYPRCALYSTARRLSLRHSCMARDGHVTSRRLMYRCRELTPRDAVPPQVGTRVNVPTRGGGEIGWDELTSEVEVGYGSSSPAGDGMTYDTRKIETSSATSDSEAVLDKFATRVCDAPQPSSPTKRPEASVASLSLALTPAPAMVAAPIKSQAIPARSQPSSPSSSSPSSSPSSPSSSSSSSSSSPSYSSSSSARFPRKVRAAAQLKRRNEAGPGRLQKEHEIRCHLTEERRLHTVCVPVTCGRQHLLGPATRSARGCGHGLTLVHVRAHLEQLQDTFMI